MTWLPPTIFVLAALQYLWNASQVWPLSGRAGGGVLCVSGAAVLVSALVFTVGLVFESRPLPPKSLLLRQEAARSLPHMRAALQIFLPEDESRWP